MTVVIDGTNGITFPDGTKEATGFKPTALLVIKHNVTGLKYFCKTSRLKTIDSYKGSGIYWKRHLKKHGTNVSVGILGIYFDRQRCIEAAKQFSENNKIGSNPNWANLIPENGLDGAPVGKDHPLYGKPSPSLGQKRPWVGKSGVDNPMFGKPSPMRGVKKPKGVNSPLYGRKRPAGGGKLSKPVVRLGDIPITYNSIADAVKDLGKNRSGITRCCLGKAKTAYGYKWCYAEELK